VRPCVLIPTYDNAASVGVVVRRARSECGLPVLVVDDGSTDGSGAVASAAGAELLVHAQNRGKGEALRTGFAAARERGFTHAISLDADGQHEPRDIALFLARMEVAPDALLVGTRRMDGPNVPRGSRVGRAISDFMLWAAAAKELKGERPDSQCGFRCYPLEHALRIGMAGRRYEFEMEVLVRAAWLGVPVLALPISVHYPPRDERVSHFRAFWDNGRIVWIYTRLMLRRLFWPITRPRRRLLPPG
jgi:glycosyltransferase involved in cell wall biosynthesis